MILITDFLALMCVTVVSLYMLWFSRKNSPPVYKVMKIMSVIIVILWITAAILYSQQ
jgi:hypothetical protein